MKTALLAAALVASSAGIADAQKYVVRNGRAVSGGGSSGGSGGSGGRGGSGPAAAPAQGVGGAPQYGAPIGGGGAGSDGRFIASRSRSGGGHRTFWGSGAQMGRNVYRVPQRALEGGSGDGSGDGGSAPEEAPPHFSKPGALIRTEGHKQFQYAETGDARQHTIDAGEIKLDPRKASHVGRAPGLKWSAPDKLPPCTPGTLGCGSSGGNAITPNSGGSGGGDTTIIHNGAHDNENGNGNGRGNNGFGGGTGFDPSF